MSTDVLPVSVSVVLVILVAWTAYNSGQKAGALRHELLTRRLTVRPTTPRPLPYSPDSFTDDHETTQPERVSPVGASAAPVTGMRPGSLSARLALAAAR